jgi:uncharacterized protein (TIGR03382 family)
VRALLAFPALVLACSGTLVACSAGPVAHDDDEPIGYSSAELNASDPVSKAVAESCTTTAVKGLAVQLIDEIQCIKPGSMTSIAKVPNTQLGSAVFPYMQTPAATSLKAVAAARSTPLVINSALRTLPQQYLLYRWYLAGRCGIGLAASPGTSNHESGLALDVSDEASWRSTFQNKGWTWLGSSDPVHFDYKGGGTVSLSGLSVLAFQRLWNRNNPNDKIAEDGDYGPATETRLVKSPVGGFAKGATCNDPPPPPKDAGAGDSGANPPPPNDDAGLPVPTQDAGDLPNADVPTADGGGCNSSGRSSGTTAGALVIVLGLALVRRRVKAAG